MTRYLQSIFAASAVLALFAGLGCTKSDSSAQDPTLPIVAFYALPG